MRQMREVYLVDFPQGKMLRSFGDRSFAAMAPTLWNPF